MTVSISTTKTTKTPQMTSQFSVCPIPFRLDPYTGCTFGCKYCFARDIIQHARTVLKKSEEEIKFHSLVTLDTEALERWIKRTLNADSDNVHRVAFKERIPIKIGGAADPFPYVERELKTTYKVLQILHEIDYPVQISTKNPSILAEYAKDFTNPNWIPSVSIITSDEELRKVIETGAPSIDSRFNAIKELSDLGINVLVRIQPTIYPYIMSNIEDLISRIHASGAKGVIMEGLKVKIAMCKEEQAIYKQIGDYLGYDIRQWYKENGQRTGSDYEIKKEDKLIYINKAKELCNKYNINFYAGDNDCREHGCSGECCGTSCLRDHKTIHQSDKLLDCKANFGRNKTQYGKTIRELLDNK